MFSGMMWLDDDRSRSLEEKVRRAVDYYQEKYGLLPELCLVNKTMLEEARDVDDVRVRPASHVVLHHFWLGTEKLDPNST